MAFLKNIKTRNERTGARYMNEGRKMSLIKINLFVIPSTYIKYFMAESRGKYGKKQTRKQPQQRWQQQHDT